MRHRQPETVTAAGFGARRWFRRVGWFVVPVVAVAALVGVTVQWLGAVEIGTSREYVGQIRPARKIARVSIPGGTALAAVVVEEGEPVRLGQVVAVLDRTDLEAQIADIDAEIDALVVEGECLSGTNEEVGSVAHASPPAKVDPTQVFRRAVALKDCALGSAADSRSQAFLARMADAVAERRGMVLRRLSLDLASARKETLDLPEKANLARRAIRLGLAANLLREREAFLSAAIDALELRHEAARLARLEEISRRVQVLADRRRRLEARLASPRLIAPGSGIVTRIRALPFGERFRADVPFIEIAREAEKQYLASASVPLREATALREGDPVELRPLGLARTGGLLRGSVGLVPSSPRGGPDDMVTIPIHLDPASAERLSDDLEGTALNGLSTATVVRVRRSRQPLSALARVATREILDPLAPPAWARAVVAKAVSLIDAQDFGPRQASAAEARQPVARETR